MYTHQCLLAPKKDVDSEYYISVLKQLMKDHIAKKWLDLVRMWKLHHRNARSHVSQRVTEFLTHKQLQVVPYPCTARIWLQTTFTCTPWPKKTSREMFSIHRCCCKGFRGDFKATVETRLRTRIPGLATPLEKVHCLEWRLY